MAFHLLSAISDDRHPVELVLSTAIEKGGGEME
jgi:hypothetical protein